MGQPDKKETTVERAVRYMDMLDNYRSALQENVRSYRDPNDLARSLASCNDVIDLAINRVAKSTLETGTDFDSAETLYESIKAAIQTRFEKKPDPGYRLAE